MGARGMGVLADSRRSLPGPLGLLLEIPIQPPALPDPLRPLRTNSTPCFLLSTCTIGLQDSPIFQASTLPNFLATAASFSESTSPKPTPLSSST